MTQTNEPASDAGSTPYNDVNMSCGHCNFSLKPTYQQASNLVQQQPIHCDQCSSDLLLDEADRQSLDHKFQTAARVGKLAVMIMGPYFLLGLATSIYVISFGSSPFPGFPAVLVGVGFALAYVLKTAATDDSEYDFVLFRNGERPAETQAP